MLTTCTRMLILLFISNSVSQAVKSLQTNNDDMIEAKSKLIAELETNIQQAENSSTEVSLLIDELFKGMPDTQKLTSKRTKLNDIDSKLSSRISSLKKEISFFAWWIILS